MVMIFSPSIKNISRFLQGEEFITYVVANHCYHIKGDHLGKGLVNLLLFFLSGV